MPLPDSSLIDEAVVQTLETDSALKAIIAAGVFWNFAPPNVTTFVSVALVDHQDDWHFNATEGDETERLVYEVVAVTLESSGEAGMREAAARIHDLLHGDGIGDVAGFNVMAVLRRRRIRETRIDVVNDLRWMYRGGQYEVTVQPLPILLTRVEQEQPHGATTR